MLRHNLAARFSGLIPRSIGPYDGRMVTKLVSVLRPQGPICCGHRAVALENRALRHRLAAWTRTATRPHLRTEIDCLGIPRPRIGLVHAGVAVRRLLSIIDNILDLRVELVT